MCGGRGVWEIPVSSPQFFCECKTAPRKVIKNVVEIGTVTYNEAFVNSSNHLKSRCED